MKEFRKKIAELLADPTGLSEDEILLELEVPPDRSLGDFAFPCFKLAKTMKKNPAQIATELAQSLSADDYFSGVEAKGPYLNFTCDFSKLVKGTIGQVFEDGQDYGNDDEGKAQTVIIDFSSPNIAKPFGFGHLRSTVIGNALANIYKTLGYTVVRINHLGDWGTQFGNLIAAYLKWGDKEELEENPVEYLYQLYVRFHQEAEENPQLKEEGREWFRKLEQGDKTAQKLWQEFKDLSLQEFERIYRMLNVNFDSYHGEAFYNDKLEDTVNQIKESGIARHSEGALVVDLPDNLPPCLIQKRDGATLYITRDLSAAIYRQNTYQFDKALYVVGADQELHFKQMFLVLEKMGFDWSHDMEHVPFGLIRFPEGKMSTRKGNLVFLEDVLNKAKQLALDIIQEKNPGLDDKESIAEMVGTGAIIFGDLSNDRVKEVTFEWDRILDFNGETAPYLQYTHARICSILNKAGTVEHQLSLLDNLKDDYERQVVYVLASFQDSIKRARMQNKPHIIARYLLDLAREFNRFYNNCPVLSESEDVKNARLMLLDAVRQVLVNGLALLGIQAPSQM